MAPILGDITTAFGLPAHPLIVHIPVMLVPLATIGALISLVVPRWRGWAVPVTAVLAGAGLLGVQLALSTGEGLESMVEESDAIERHSQLAEQARPFVALFFVVAAVGAYLVWRSHKAAAGTDPDTPTATGTRSGATATMAKALVPVLALSVVTGALATTWIVRTGHSGAKSVWEEDVKKSDTGDKTDKGVAPDGDSDGD